MAGTFDLKGFGAFLMTAAVTAKGGEARGLEKAAEIVERESKRVIGTYDYGWPQLAESTLSHKANGNTPLLETGEMRDSIQHTVQGKSAFVGSNDDKAVWQELGTSRIPPRSFLMQAAVHKEKEVVHAIAKEVLGGLVTVK